MPETTDPTTQDVHTVDTPADGGVCPADTPAEGVTDADSPESETFTREYVQRLRDEAAGHRVKAKRADALAARLVTAQAALTGKLADPTDLPFHRGPARRRRARRRHQGAGGRRGPHQAQAAPGRPSADRRRRAGPPAGGAGNRDRRDAAPRLLSRHNSPETEEGRPDGVLVRRRVTSRRIRT